MAGYWLTALAELLAPGGRDFDDWRDVEGRSLPVSIRVNDGKAIYSFRFRSMSLSQ